MLFLSGFEPYSRWVPLLSTVLSVVRSLKLSNHNDDGSQQTGLLNKWFCVLSNSRSSILYCQVKLDSYGLHPSSKRKQNLRRRVCSRRQFYRRNSKFHVGVLWLTSKKCTKKRDARTMLLFYQWKQLFLCRYPRRRPRNGCFSSLVFLF